MAPLPEVRVTGLVHPFTHTGVDYFGPIQVKEGYSLVKRWVALFTCLTVRAIHVELVHSLSTQSCIMAIRRFVARRDSPESFHSDNGTNFLGASNLLTKEIQDIHEDCAATFTNWATSWEFNPASAPHMRSMKVAMSEIAGYPHHPSDEVLQTVATEAEPIVDSRPLTYISLESTEQESLTPNHFLLFAEPEALDEGDLKEENLLRNHAEIHRIKEAIDVLETLCGMQNECLSHYVDTFQSWCDKHVALVGKVK
ncbi:uncharacterized protein LOC135709597 [Ochlerotatus camptorhynchus]|uniref:uncharacterized protein LOC135709597 n=1 Tax=Ochlerotatus camptorhynchus TaxID=644619 RepID=UPI0031DB4C21